MIDRFTYIEKVVPPDEPVFILRAQDNMAPSVIEIWADKVDIKRGTSCNKTIEARQLAHEMRVWQERHHKKLPD